MTEEKNNENKKEIGSHDKTLTRNFDELDIFLQKLVSLVNTTKVEMGISLNVGGLVISGTLFTGEEYFKIFASDFSKGFEQFEEKEVSIIRKSLETWGDVYKNSEKINVDDVIYIHLKNAKFFVPGQKPIPSNAGVCWRGKISAVDGFTLGKLSSSDD